jgi:anti-sigma regulatory factor (Ser/Thr protein kinase)
MAAAASFDFETLDGLAFAAERGRLNGRTPALISARDLGPVIELSELASTGLLPRPEQAKWLNLDGLSILNRVLSSGRSQWISPDGRRIGVLRMAAQPRDETAWIFAAQKAAAMAGFPRIIAQQLAAAIGELHSNVYEHSRAPQSGLMAFRAGTSNFEFVVTDRGIGVLESLRTCPEYAHLRDHGEALKLALNEGVSRFGPNTGHGFGFRPIFVGLANIKGYLRFRSGDHALIIDGTEPSLMTARPAQKPLLPGFFISVNCKARSG